MQVVFSVKVEISAYISAKKISRKSDYWPVAAQNKESINLQLLNQPENLHRFIPGFILGKTRELYKVSKIIDVLGPLGNNKEARQ